MGNKARLAGGAAAAVILAVVVIAFLPRPTGQDAAPGSAGADAAVVPQADTERSDISEQTTPDPATGPKVDTYLLGPDGIAVVAGQATPGATVTLLLEGQPMGEALADASGSFAMTAEVTASDAPRSLTFSENGAAASGDVVLVRPGTGAAPAGAETTLAMAEAVDGGATKIADAAGGGSTAPTGDEPATAPAATGTAGAEPAPGDTSDATGGNTTTGTASVAPASGDALDGTIANTATETAGIAPATGDAVTTVVTDPASDRASADGTGAASAPATDPTADGEVATATAAGSPTAADTATAADAVVASTDMPRTDAPDTNTPTIVVDATGARVLGPGPQVMDRVALDAITYDAEGAVQLAGRAPEDGTLQVYVDNRPVTTGPVGARGDWRLTLPDIDPGTYTLRIDELGPDGTVASRVETPFRREAPQDVAALRTGDGTATITTQTVQPGNTLWAIARENFGDGFLYVRVFEANADQIRDPDLIYPGQVFVIPD